MRKKSPSTNGSNIMMNDPLVEDVRSARQKIFEACHEDLDALLDRLQEQEKLDQDRLVSDLTAQPKRDRRQVNRVHPREP
jgi:hypothetical protein